MYFLDGTHLLEVSFLQTSEKHIKFIELIDAERRKAANIIEFHSDAVVEHTIVIL